MRALLDVNVLIALFDAAHVHHRAASDWLGANIEQGWASCPLTQNGCLRILSQPRYPNAVPLAVRRGGRLVTFDRAVPLGAIAGATRDNLVLL